MVAPDIVISASRDPAPPIRSFSLKLRGGETLRRRP
jgi:hypothetical protein